MSLFSMLEALFNNAVPQPTPEPVVVPTPAQHVPTLVTSGPVAPTPAVTGLLSVLPQAIKLVAPRLPPTDIAAWAAALAGPMAKAEMNTPKRCAAFLGQLAEESAEFTATRENLNYSAQRLMQVWPSRFPNLTIANQYAHNPEALANFVYANRLGNGNTASGDGWKFRGGGPIQLTGRSTLAAFGKTVGKTAEDAADYVATPQGGAASACWFWTTRNINPLADDWDIEGITKKVNGGLTNLDQRTDFSEAELKEFTNGAGSRSG